MDSIGREVSVVRGGARPGGAGRAAAPGAGPGGRDELGSDPAGPPSWLLHPRPGLVAALAALVLLAGGVAARTVEEPVPTGALVAPVVTVVGGSLEPGPRAAPRGELVVALSNPSDARLRLGSLRLAAEGLQQGRTSPAFGQPLPGRQSREYALAFTVPSCGGLRLPARLLLSVLDEQGRARTTSVLLDGGPGGRVFAPCPPGTTLESRPSLAVSGIGGTTERSGGGASGVLRLEVRNGGDRLQLLSVFAELPGARFAVVGRPNGVTLVTDEQTEVRLAFEVDDCARLGRTGVLTARVRLSGREQDVAFQITDARASRARQNALDRVLLACAR